MVEHEAGDPVAGDGGDARLAGARGRDGVLEVVDGHLRGTVHALVDAPARVRVGERP